MVTAKSPQLALARRLLREGEGRAIRELAGVSEAEVARDVGVHASTISRWETSRRLPRGQAAVRYCELLAELLSVETIGAERGKE